MKALILASTLTLASLSYAQTPIPEVRHPTIEIAKSPALASACRYAGGGENLTLSCVMVGSTRYFAVSGQGRVGMASDADRNRLVVVSDHWGIAAAAWMRMRPITGSNPVPSGRVCTRTEENLESVPSAIAPAQ